MCFQDVPDTPEAPREINPLEILATELFFNRQNSESPMGRQEYGSYDADGNWVAFNSAAYGDAYATFLNDAMDGNDSISQASIQALLQATPTESRMIEDPRLRAIREQDQNINNWRQQIGMGYMNQFGGNPQALPDSQYGLPSGGRPGQAGYGGAGLGGAPNPFASGGPDQVGSGFAPGQMNYQKPAMDNQGSVGPGQNQGFNIPTLPGMPGVSALNPGAYDPMQYGSRPEMTPLDFRMRPDNNALGGVAGTQSMPFTTSSSSRTPMAYGGPAQRPPMGPLPPRGPGG